MKNYERVLDSIRGNTYFVHGSEPFQMAEFCDVLKLKVKEQGISERLVFEVSTKECWQKISVELDSLSLFASERLIEVRPEIRALKDGERTIEKIFYKPGKFLNASLDKASEENERNYYKLKTNKDDDEIIIVQIAGLIARRIVCEVKEEQKLSQGERLGMIRFGSRVDVYFNNRKTLAKVGQKTVAGESLIAKD